MIILYMTLLFWFAFLGFGGIPLDSYDWPRETAYLAVLREALTTLTLPLYHSGGLQDTNMFLGIPDVPLSPDLLLLPILSPRAFFVVHILLACTAGFLGTRELARRRGWGPLAFAGFFLLFNLGGSVTAHLAIGHTWWTAYFLLPFFVTRMLAWVELAPTEPGPNAGEIAEIALIVFAMSLLGGFHFCNWCVMFVALLGLRRQRWLNPAGVVVVLSVLLTAYRWLPTMATFERYGWAWAEGFSSPGQVLRALAVASGPETRVPGGMAWWEYDMYVGVVGLGLVIAGGVMPLIRAAISKGLGPRQLGLRQLDPRQRDGSGYLLLPVAVLLALAFRGPVAALGSDVPILGAERVATRMVALPLVVLIALAGGWLDRRFLARKRLRWIGVALLIAVAGELGWHAWLWKVGSLPPTTGTALAEMPRIAAGDGGVYEGAVAAGYAISLVNLGLCAWLVLRRRRRRPG